MTRIISCGRCAKVSKAQLEQVRHQNLSWYSYCQARLTRTHDEALNYMARYKRAA